MKNRTASASFENLEILIVDDDEVLCARLESLLSASGIRSLSVYSLRAASEAMRAVYFPVVVLDRKLGDGDGLALCREYRARLVDRKVSILVLSAADSPADEKLALAAGADDFLSKSCSDEELVARVTQLYTIAAGKPALPLDAGPTEDRLRILSEYGISDTTAEQAYDDIVRLASTICSTPIALISFVESERQWFKAKTGFALAETPREHALCAHAIEKPDEVMIVCDTAQDARFTKNPLVTEQGIRFYAGAPLVTPDGHALGTLCVMDRVRRTLNDDALAALRALARQVMLLLEQRRTRRQLEHALTAQRAADAELRRTSKVFAAAFENAPIGMALVAVTGHWLRVNAAVCEILGYTPEHLLRTNFQELTHPDDLQADLHCVQDLLAGKIRRYQMDKRYFHKEGHVVPVRLSVSLVRDDAGVPLYFISQLQKRSEDLEA